MAWYNSDWKYRIPITITETSGSTLTDFQVKVVVDTASLVSAGKMNADGSDIRFTDSDGSTELSFWIEDGTMNTASTVIWVKVTSIPANGTVTIYMYYSGKLSFQITENSGADLTDYQVKLPIILDNAHKYVINRQGQAETLSWWSDGETGTWVKVPLIPASGTVTIEVVRDETSGIVGNIDNTFIAGDDFDDGVIDTNKWYVYTDVSGTVVESNGTLKATGQGAGNYTAVGVSMSLSPTGNVISPNVIIEAKANTPLYDCRVGVTSETAWSSFVDAVLYWVDASNRTTCMRFVNGSGFWFYSGNEPGGWHHIKLVWTPSKIDYYRDNTLLGSATTDIPTGNVGLNICAWEGNTVEVDWIFARKYATTEPTITAIEGAKTSINSTFILGDDFNDGTIAGTPIDGTWTESGGTIAQTLDTTTGLDNSYDMGALTVSDNIIFEAKAKTTAVNVGWVGIALASGTATYIDGVLDIYNNWVRIMDISSDAIVTDVSTPITTDETSYHIIKLTRTGTTYTVEIEGVTATLTSSLVPTNAYLQSRRATDYFEFAYVRKYASSDPTIALGAEESQWPKELIFKHPVYYNPNNYRSKATLFVTGSGSYEIYLSPDKVTWELLTPGTTKTLNTSSDKWYLKVKMLAAGGSIKELKVKFE